MSRARLAAWLGAIALLLAALPAAAEARSDKVTDADVGLRLAPDTSLLVQERLTFEYDGSFQASYRDIPLREGERITDIRVNEGGRQYQPGACTTFGCVDQPGRFGATPFGDGARIVWHHGAADESRTFVVSYRVVDWVIAYDDVIDVNWKVWGDQWNFDLDHLRPRCATRR